MAKFRCCMRQLLFCIIILFFNYHIYFLNLLVTTAKGEPQRPYLFFVTLNDAALLSSDTSRNSLLVLELPDSLEMHDGHSGPAQLLGVIQGKEVENARSVFPE